MAVDDWTFYFITDSRLTRQGIIADAGAAISAGVKVIQYREKLFPPEVKLREANLLAACCEEAGIDLVINDDIELARTVGARGVHLGSKDMPLSEARHIFDGIIGVSINRPADVKSAEELGADYIAVSPVFHTTTKADISEPLGIEGIGQFRKLTNLHLTAIGGINLENAKDVINAGADSICAIKASVDVDDVEKRVREFEGLFG